MCCFGCSGGPELKVPDGTPIVLISIDTLRSDRLPAYGYDGVETPAIDQFRKDSILFERAYCNVPLTLPSHTSIFTGLLPSTHGVRDNLGYTIDTAKARLMQQTLKDAGYATGAGVSAYALRRATGFNAGFDFFDDAMEFAQSEERPGAETLDAVRPWLRSVADRPFFLFFHIFEPHLPYEPPPEYAARYPSSYDGEVAASDAVVGGLLDELRALDLYERALIVFLSDHGEDLGDHGEYDHGVFLYRSTLQVPLILKLPQAERAGKTVSEPVQLIDVLPTILSALGQPVAEDLRGTPLLARSRPDPRTNPIYSETFFPRLHFGWSDLAALIAGRSHYIDAPQPELYDIINDPDEKDNLLGADPELEKELKTVLGRFDRELVAPVEVDAETRRRLEALGYVGGAPMTDEEGLPDPKTRVHTMADIMRAYTLYHDGELESAVPALQKVVEENPKIEDAWGYLVLALLNLGRPDEAADTTLIALKQLPESKELPLKAARLLAQLGRLDEATVCANVAIAREPAAAHTLLAQIAVENGDFEGAEAHARAAISSGSQQPEPRLIWANALLSRGQAREAIDLLTRTLEEGIVGDPARERLAFAYAAIGDFRNARAVVDDFEGPVRPSLLLQFGQMALERQMWAEAKEWAERTRRIVPDHPTIPLILGIVALNEGRLPEARTLLQDAVAVNLESAIAWSSLGLVFARLGDPGGAVIAWERALKISPTSIEIKYNLGLAHAQLGNASQAIFYLEDFAALARPGPQRQQALEVAQKLRTLQSH
jgi:arylsulfatase A-like enzyme/Flp pilus assembly protein TadD